MSLILIILCGVLMGAFNLGFFLLGVYYKTKHPDEDAVTVTKENAELIEEMMKWRNYGGGQ